MDALQILRSVDIPLPDNDELEVQLKRIKQEEQCLQQGMSLEEIAKYSKLPRKDALEALLTLMERIYIPALLNEQRWPEITRIDLRGAS